jgi:putative membrane protein
MLPASFYLWIKALHVISVIAWMAGLLYLPRLYVYHCVAAAGSVQSETFKVMERRLLRAIMTPAMIATWSFGLMLWTYQTDVQPWLYVKLVLVAMMTGAHIALGRFRLGFERDQNHHSQKFYRVFNEVPTLLMIAIVILVIVRPF